MGCIRCSPRIVLRCLRIPLRQRSRAGSRLRCRQRRSQVRKHRGHHLRLSWCRRAIRALRSRVVRGLQRQRGRDLLAMEFLRSRRHLRNSSITPQGCDKVARGATCGDSLFDSGSLKRRPSTRYPGFIDIKRCLPDQIDPRNDKSIPQGRFTNHFVDA